MPVSRNRRASRRRANRTLSNYKIATKTSARAQARQIYALARRISAIQRRTRPEIVTIQRTASAVNFETSAGNARWLDGSQGTLSTSFVVPPLGPNTDSSYGSATTPVPNNFARLLSFTLYGDLRYNAYVNTNIPFTLRIVVIQTLSTRSDNLSETDIFTGNNTNSSSDFAMVYGPLQTGLARTAKVLSDKRYTLSYQQPSVTIKTRLRYLLNYYRDTTSSTTGSSENTAKGAIYVFYATYTTSREVVPTLSLMCKLAYSDA